MARIRGGAKRIGEVIAIGIFLTPATMARSVGSPLWLLIVWQKGRPFASGDVFRASRLSRGNRLFPTQVLITDSSVVQFTPRWIGTSGRSAANRTFASTTSRGSESLIDTR